MRWMDEGIKGWMGVRVWGGGWWLVVDGFVIEGEYS